MNDKGNAGRPLEIDLTPIYKPSTGGQVNPEAIARIQISKVGLNYPVPFLSTGHTVNLVFTLNEISVVIVRVYTDGPITSVMVLGSQTDATDVNTTSLSAVPPLLSSWNSRVNPVRLSLEKLIS